MGKYINRIIIFYLGFFCALSLTAQMRKDIPAGLIKHSETAINNIHIIPTAALMVPDTFPTLPVIKQDFLVNELAGDYGCEQWYPAIAADSSGNYAVAWADQRNVRPEIYIQFFNNLDEPVGANVLVSEEGASSYYTHVLIAANKRGDFVVAWGDKYNIMSVQKFSSSGIKIGHNIKLGAGGWNDLEVAMAVADDGNYLICWSAGYYRQNILGYLINASADSVVIPISLNDNPSAGNIYNSLNGAAVDGQGNFVVVWRKLENNISRIFLQQLDLQGNKIGTNVLVSDSTDLRRHYDPAVAATDDGNFFIVWNSDDPQNINGGTTARIYRSNGQTLSDQIIISASNSYLYSSLLVGNRKDSFWIFIFNQENGTMRCQKIGKTGELQGATIVQSLDSADSLYIHDMNIASIFADQFFITFLRYHRGDTEVFAQLYDQNLLPLNEPIKGNKDQFSSWQTDPLICINQQGGSIVLWEDCRNGRHDLYAQVYDPDFNQVGENMMINDQGQNILVDKKVGSAINGMFVIAFCGGVNYGELNIYLQAVDFQGHKIKANKLAKELYWYGCNLELKVDDHDQILLCWYDQYSAWMQKYDQDLLAISSEKGLYKYDQNRDFKPVTISINKDFNIFVNWVYYDRQTYDYDKILYGLVYDQAGKVISDTMIINKWNSYHYVDALDNYITDENDYVIVWIDDAGSYAMRMFATDRLYSYTNSIRGINYSDCRISIPYSKNQKTLITYSTSYDIVGFFFNDNKRQSQLYRLYRYNSSTYGDGQFYHTAIFKDNLFFTYESNQQGETGFDIWMNVQRLGNLNFEPEVFRPPITDDILYPNFPNPFNETTKIDYELLAFHKVKLSIYDVLGREVRVLVDRNQEKGYYEAEFNAAGLASGIYFCRLQAFRTQIRKMVVIK